MINRENIDIESTKYLAMNEIECEFIQLETVVKYGEPEEVERQKGRIIGFAHGMCCAGIFSMSELKAIWDDERLK